MPDNFKAIIYPVKDLENAKTLFTALLGAPPDQDAPYYVGWSIEGQNIGLNPHGFDQGMTGPVPSWVLGVVTTPHQGVCFGL